jgi:hypothetical protein
MALQQSPDASATVTVTLKSQVLKNPPKRVFHFKHVDQSSRLMMPKICNKLMNRL